MHSLHLLLTMATGVCLFIPPLVQTVCMDLDDDDIDELMFYHNAIRSNVHPRAANMRQMVWSDELAEIAAVNACQCNFQYTGLPPIPYRQHYARENHIYYPTNNLGSMVTYWYLEHANYNYHKRECYGDSTCEHYLNMVWARACEVGCALSVCHPEEIYDDLDEGDPDPKPESANGQGSQIIDRLFMLVCVYGAGFPGDADLGNYYPYWAGEPCSECPRDRFPLCFNETSAALGSPPEPMDLLTFGVGEEPVNPPVYPPWQLLFLCYNDQEACIGSDPHFAIRLSGGAILCYTFQGQTNTVFNLFSNDQLQMNALIIPDDNDYHNTWLGSIGIVVRRRDGKKITTLQFTAADHLVQIGERVGFEAKTIKKLSFHEGKLTKLEVPSNHTPRFPRVRVEFVDIGLDFTIKFTKSNHLDLYWHSIRATSKKSEGIVGQFFRDGVRIDEDARVLRMPGRPPVPVEEQELWKFTKQNFHRDSKCWTSAYHSSQGAGIVPGTFQDYIVEDLLSVVQ